VQGEKEGTWAFGNGDLGIANLQRQHGTKAEIFSQGPRAKAERLKAKGGNWKAKGSTGSGRIFEAVSSADFTAPKAHSSLDPLITPGK
jgi:hypothetical protein